MVAEVICPKCGLASQQDELTDHILAQRSCSSCEEGGLAAARCEDCKELLCQDCTTAHLRVSLTRSHRLVTLLNPTVCFNNHPDNPQLFCLNCRRFICSQCSPPAGCSRDHEWRPHHTVADGVRKEFRQNINKLQQKKIELEKSMSSLRSSIVTVGSYEKTLELQFEQIKENLLKVLQDRHQKLAEEVTRKRKIMERRTSHLQNIRAQIDHSTELVQSVLQSSVPDQNLLKVEELIRAQLKRLDQSKVTQRPCDVESRLELSFRSKFRGNDLHDNINNVIRLVLRDVQLDVQVREEEAGAARVSQSQSQPPEKEGERQPVRQKQTR